MKIKDLERTVNVTWSPATQYPILLATGTAAQQLDASFSTNATLELYSLNLSDPGMDMELIASTQSDNRFYKIVWGSYGTGSDKRNGVLVGGCDGGIIQIYSAAKLLDGEDCLISRQDKHTGPVQSLDFNPFQQNLLASGAAESEIYIWDLNNTNTPMTPGTKSQPFEPVQCLSWNRQVQHILATAFSSRCVVWDLRKNEPIIKLTDTSSHIRWKHVSWHPDVATQLCLASEEDQAPIIQLWDLRFATSPLKVLDNHQRGVLSIAWCDQDPDLLISCGKDNKILCWNPNSNAPRGEVLSEVAHTLQWNFDVAWCPRNPAIIAASSFDGHVSVYSLHGGRQTQVQTSNKIADSFPGMDGYVQAPAMQQQQQQVVSVDLGKAPKWLKRPAGASFAFGGRLITFENDKNTAAQIQQAAQVGQVPPLINRSVTISQVITEPELIQKSTELEQAIQQGNFAEYCRQKADSSQFQHERYVWYFLKANFDPNPKSELLNLLGYQPEDVSNKLKQYVKKPEVTQNVVNDLTDHLAALNRGEEYNASSTFDAIAADAKIAETETKRLNTPFKISTGNDTDGLIAQAILLGNIEAAVELCLEADRMADALIIAMTGGSDLLARTQYRYLQQSEGYVASLISALVSEDWSSIINQCSVDSWKEALAAAITYCSNEELPLLCERMGERLENENNGDIKLVQDAQLCYICAGSFNKLVASWSSEVNSQDPKKLQELVELITFMQKAIEQQGRPVDVTGNLADLLSHYAILLASQGSLSTALNYLGASVDPQIDELRERLYCNLGHKPAYAVPQQQQQQQQQQPFQSRRVSNTRQSVPGYTPQPNNYAQPSYPKFNTGLPNAAPTQQPWLGQNTVPAPAQNIGAPPPKPFSPAPVAPPTQPPRPTSVGSAHGGSKSKYVVDPSVQSNLPTQYGRSMYGAPAPMPMQAPVQPQPVPLLPTSPAAKPYPAPFTPASAAPQMINHQNFSNPIQSQTMAPVPGSFPMQQPFQNMSSAPSVPFQPAGNVEVAQQAINAFPPVSSPPGWNDPPAVNKSGRPQYPDQYNMSATHAGTRLWKTKLGHHEPPKTDYAPHAPITHPLFGSAPDPTPMNNGFGDQLSHPYGQAPPPGPMNPATAQQPPMNNFNPQANQFNPQTNQFNQQANHFNPQAHFAQQQAFQQPQMQTQAPPQQQHAPPPEPVKKSPIPEEHIHLQTVFDELKTQCTCTANNPQTKRKLEDVTRKLESMYDMLREHKLSANTLAGLHQMVQLVQSGDYTGGLNLHTQLVSGPDFAQIASFMPGLKVLLQCALQLQVYLR